LAELTDRPSPQPAITEDSTTAGFGWVKVLWRGMAPLLRPHRRPLALIIVLMTVELGLQLAQRKAFSTLIDEAILQPDIRLMALILGLMLAAAILSGAAGICHEILQARLCASVPGEVRARLFDHTQRLPLSRLRTSTHGDLITRLTSDAGSVEPALWSLGYVVTALVGIIIAIALLLWTEWRLALLGIVLLPLVLVGPRILTPRAAHESYAAKTAIGGLATHLQENFANQIVLRVFGLARVARQRFDEHNQRIVETSRRYNLYSYFSYRVPWIAIELIDLTILAVGCWMVLRGDLTTGGLVAFYLLFSSLASHTYSLTTSLPGLIGAAAGMRRIRELLRIPVDDGDAGAPTAAQIVGATAEPHRAPAIRFDQVSFRYPAPIERATDAQSAEAGAGDQLSAASFTVAPSALTAFVGASGSGKSTALQVLLGLQRPRAGRVLVDDQDLADLPRAEYWAHLSAVFQDSLLFNTSIAENIRAGKLTATDAEVEAAARAAGIAAWASSLPDAYATIVSGDTCSGGQRQRIALARALIREPSLLVLDEPTSALDPATGRAVMQTLLKVSVGRTSVLVTHQLRDAAHAGRIIVFDRGLIAESGTHVELLAAQGVYASLWHEQQQRDTPG
jgi:ATP-binding cassette subfamily B protein